MGEKQWQTFESDLQRRYNWGVNNMQIETKVQIIFAIFLSLELLGLFMIIIRTIANMEHALNRVEEIIGREVQLAHRLKDNERLTKEKSNQNDMSKDKKNDLLLNIPFMERLHKENKKDHG
jgi:hypothetical protein